MQQNQILITLEMSKRKKTAPVIDSDSDESDSGSNLDEVCNSCDILGKISLITFEKNILETLNFFSVKQDFCYTL